MKYSLVALIAVLLASACHRDGEIPPEQVEARETRYDNGQIKERFGVVQTDAGSYERHGKFTSFHLNGQKSEEGTFAKDERDGEWMAWHENGKVRSKGRYEKGERAGEFIDYWDDGTLRAKSHYKQGKRDGKFVEYDEKGVTTLELTWANDVLNGPVHSYLDGKEIVTGGFENGKTHGRWSVKNGGGRELGSVTMARGAYQGSVHNSPPAPEATPDCPALFDFHFGKSTYADVKLGFLDRGLVPPELTRDNPSSGGRMIKLSGEEYGLKTVTDTVLVFDQRGLLVGARLNLPKGDNTVKGYRANFDQLLAELGPSTRVVTKKYPFVGDTSAKLRSANCGVFLDAPHLGFDMSAEYWLNGSEEAVAALR